jgi:ABC-type multidrug transport system permease subunit
MDQSFIQSLYEQRSYTNDISIVANEATTTVRYFYALLGFASIMAAMIGMVAIVRTQANLSALGARRSVGATSRTKTLVATLAAAWLVSYVCLLVAFCYMRFVLGINFGRDIESMLGLLVASFMTCGLGAFIGAIPKLGEGSKSGILTGLSCLMSLFAGLYGEPTMALADNLAKNAPVIQLLNPARQVTELFYSLYYYDTYESFFTTILILLISGAVLFICAAVFMRRQRYASL